jgi:hypothetical protein
MITPCETIVSSLQKRSKLLSSPPTANSEDQTFDIALKRAIQAVGELGWVDEEVVKKSLEFVNSAEFYKATNDVQSLWPIDLLALVAVYTMSNGAVENQLKKICKKEFILFETVERRLKTLQTTRYTTTGAIGVAAGGGGDGDGAGWDD